MNQLIDTLITAAILFALMGVAVLASAVYEALEKGEQMSAIGNRIYGS